MAARGASHQCNGCGGNQCIAEGVWQIAARMDD